MLLEDLKDRLRGLPLGRQTMILRSIPRFQQEEYLKSMLDHAWRLRWCAPQENLWWCRRICQLLAPSLSPEMRVRAASDLGNAFRIVGRLAEARTVLESPDLALLADKIDPRGRSAYLSRRASLALALGTPTVAESLLTEALGLQPPDETAARVGLWIQWATAVADRDPLRALRAVTEAARSLPTEASRLRVICSHNAAEFALALNRPREAQLIIRRLWPHYDLVLEPALRGVRWHLSARIERALGRNDRARIHFERAIDAHADGERWQLLLLGSIEMAEVCIELEDYVEAGGALKRALPLLMPGGALRYSAHLRDLRRALATETVTPALLSATRIWLQRIAP